MAKKEPCGYCGRPTMSRATVKGVKMPVCALAPMCKEKGK
jgi:hypothetical protein